MTLDLPTAARIALMLGVGVWLFVVGADALAEAVMSA